jgi:hypothetical protein
MIESDILRETAADHHGKQHDPIVPDIHSNDGATHIPEYTHEDKERSHGKEEIRPKERRIPMQKRFASALTSLTIALIFILGIAASKIQAANIQDNRINEDIQAGIVTDGIQIVNISDGSLRKVISNSIPVYVIQV